MNRYDNNVRTCILLFACLTAMSGCKDSYFNEMQPDDSRGSQIILSGRYGGLSRASDAGFANGDIMGIFISDYENGNPCSLGNENLHAKNVKFTYSEETDRWTGSTTLYWNDDSTPIDVYGYYPFDSSISDPLSHTFRVATRQNTESTSGTLSAYEQADFLWAKALGITPTSETINLEYRHAMAGVTVILEAGEGFGADEFAKLEKIVWIDNTVPDAVINLEKQTISATEGKCERIYPLTYKTDYRAVVVPQTVSAGKCVIGLNVGGKDYQLKKESDLSFISGKMHTFTVKVDKKSDSGDYVVTLLPESITAWIDDPTFHDGLMYEYMIVNVTEAGTLKKALKSMGTDPAKIEALKICGPLNADDRYYIGTDLENCSALNLADAVMVDDELTIIWTDGWMVDGHIHHIIYPKTPFKKLGNVGGSVRGNQIIPEGVEEIHGFVVAPGTQVSFPTTLKRIGDIFGELRGELLLPEGLESYGDINGYFTGNIHLPESLKELGSIKGKFNSGLTIPQGVKTIPSEAFNHCTFMGLLNLPAGIENIRHRAFETCGFSGELVLPESLKEIESVAFAWNKFTAIVWPKDLAVIGNNAFEGCNRLQGTIEIPKKVRSINEAAFKGCSLITALDLHEDIDYIGCEAFAGCERLNIISCKAETPPLVGARAFEGVGMDHVLLEVPASAVNAYRTAPGWKEFKRISPYRDFSVYPSQIQALNNLKIQTITVNAKGSWKLGAHPAWCTVTPSSGTGKTQVDVTVSNLTSGSGDRNATIEFESADESAVVSVEVAQYDYKYGEDSAVTLQSHSKGNGIPLYFIGDGWTGENIASGAYLQQCEEDMEHFFGINPYNAMRDYFDVYSLVALSQEKGVNTIYNYRDTRFSTIYAASMGQLLPDETLILDYLKEETNGISISDSDLRKGLIILVPNTTDYGGVTYYYDGDVTISICPPTTNPYPMDNRGVVQHEACGHGFGKLGDELIIKNAFATAGITSQIESLHGSGWYMNLATTSNMNLVPWSDMIFDPRYSDRVDVFEGGFGYTRGIFRSESNSCMNLGIPYFNSISRLDITKRILEKAGEPFDIDSFYENDTFEWGNTANITNTRGYDAYGMSEIPNHKAPVFLTTRESKRLLDNVRSQQKNNTKLTK